MAGSQGKVRLVRCPKCENLLPEVTDYSVYSCGGCGAVLRAKNKSVVSDTFSEKSDEESLERGFDKFTEKHDNANFPKRRGMILGDRYENNVKSSGISSSRVGEYNNNSLTKAEKWVVEEDLELNNNAHELGISETARRFNGLNFESRSNTHGPTRSEQNYDRRRRENEMDRFQNTQNSDVDSLIKPVGPSRYHSGSDYGYAQILNNRNGLGTVNRAEFVEDDRAELLRKLDELKDQINRSGQMVDRSKEQVFHGRTARYQDPYNNGPENRFHDGSNRVPMKYPMPDNMARPQFSNYSDTSSYASNQGFGDPYGSNMVRRAPPSMPELFEQGQFRPYNSGQYINKGAADMDLRDNYIHSSNLHHPSCSCYQCYNKPEQVMPVIYRHENPNGFAPRDYNPSTNSNHSRWSSDVNSEFGGVVRALPRRALLAANGRRCRPVSGGAPFITCSICFELLQLPKKVFSKEKTQKKMRCGSCSELIFISIVDKKLVLSVLIVHSQLEEVPKNVDDNSGYDFQPMDAKVLSSPAGPTVGSNKSEAMTSHYSTSSCASADEEEPKAAEVSTEASSSSPHNRVGPGNSSGRSEMNEVMSPLKTASHQSSMKEATEIEIPSNEYFNNTGTFQESGDVIREDQIRGSGGGESFFAGIKKSFKDFSRSSQHVEDGNINVTVNGHYIPDRLVKKAEKLAGKIQPGNYWYDSRAGFWGVIGGPCRGIIPPFIEEFNYPMPEKCAGGNTGVFVNGRELNQTDLELLGSRGLPTDTDGSYIIEISGRVLDVESGEELDSLGKLAPTVEKAKRGFGMKVPRTSS